MSSAIAALSFVNATTQERVDDPETKQALLDDVQILDSSLQYINDLLRNMLDIHRTASKKMKLDEGLTDVLQEIFEPVTAILCVKQNKAKIIVDCPENLVVVVDRLRVKQIRLNLAYVRSTVTLFITDLNLQSHPRLVTASSSPSMIESIPPNLFKMDLYDCAHK